MSPVERDSDSHFTFYFSSISSQVKAQVKVRMTFHLKFHLISTLLKKKSEVYSDEKYGSLHIIFNHQEM